MIDLASNVGRELDITTLEEAALGDVSAADNLRRIEAEIASSLGGPDLGAARTRTGEISGLIED